MLNSLRIFGSLMSILMCVVAAEAADISKRGDDKKEGVTITHADEIIAALGYLDRTDALNAIEDNLHNKKIRALLKDCISTEEESQIQKIFGVGRIFLKLDLEDNKDYKWYLAQYNEMNLPISIKQNYFPKKRAKYEKKSRNLFDVLAYLKNINLYVFRRNNKNPENWVLYHRFKINDGKNSLKIFEEISNSSQVNDSSNAILRAKRASVGSIPNESLNKRKKLDFTPNNDEQLIKQQFSHAHEKLTEAQNPRNPKIAWDAHTLALEIRVPSPSDAYYKQYHRLFSDIYLHIGNANELCYFDYAFEHALKAEDPTLAIKADLARGTLTKNFSEANLHLNRALKSARLEKDRDDLIIKTLLSLAYRKQFFLETREEYAKEALDMTLHLKIKDIGLELKAYNMLGYIYLDMYKNKREIEKIEKSKTFFELALGANRSPEEKMLITKYLTLHREFEFKVTSGLKDASLELAFRSRKSTYLSSATTF